MENCILSLLNSIKAKNWGFFEHHTNQTLHHDLRWLHFQSFCYPLSIACALYSCYSFACNVLILVTNISDVFCFFVITISNVNQYRRYMSHIQFNESYDEMCATVCRQPICQQHRGVCLQDGCEWHHQTSFRKNVLLLFKRLGQNFQNLGPKMNSDCSTFLFLF